MTGMKCTFTAKIASEVQMKPTKTGSVTTFEAEYLEYDGSTSSCPVASFNGVARHVGQNLKEGDQVIVEGSVMQKKGGVVVHAARVTSLLKQEEVGL